VAASLPVPVPVPPRLYPARRPAVAAGLLAGVIVTADWARAASAPAARHAVYAAEAAGRAHPSTLHEGLEVMAVVFLLAWFAASLWLFQVHATAAAIAPGRMRRSAVWTSMGWVVPVVSLWFPKQIVDDSARVSAAALAARGRRLRPVPTGAWWIAWLVYLALANRAGLLQDAAGVGAAGGRRSIHPELEILVAVAGTVALVLWLRVLRDVTRANDALVGTAGRPGPAA